FAFAILPSPGLLPPSPPAEKTTAAVTGISFTEQLRQLLFFGQPDQQRRSLPEKASFYGRVVRSVVGVQGVRMNIDDSRLMVRFQRLMTEMLVEKRLGQRRPGLTDDLYQTWRDVGRRGLKEAPEYRDVLLRADRHALWLAGLVRLAAPPVSSPETERTDTLDGPQKAA